MLPDDSIRAQSRYFSREVVTVARRVWRTFCRHGKYNFELYECRGTRLIGTANLSPVTKLGEGTGAVSRFKLSRSQKFVMVQDFNCGQMRVSRVKRPLRICLECRSKSKKCDKQLTFIVRVSRSFLQFKKYHDTFEFILEVIKGPTDPLLTSIIFKPFPNDSKSCGFLMPKA